MEKRLPLIALALILILSLSLLTGCSAGSIPGTSEPTGQAGNTATNTGQGQRPDRTMDLLAKVETVNGDKFTVAELKMPERPQGNKAGGYNQDSQSGAGQPGQTPQANQDGSSGSAGSNTPSGNAGGRQTSGQKPITYEETGTKYTIVMPTGTVVVSRTMGTNGPEQKNIAVSEIKVGDILRLWVDKLDKSGGESTVVYAELTAPRTN